MKKFNYFLLIAFTSITFSTFLNASPSIQMWNIEHIQPTHIELPSLLTDINSGHSLTISQSSLEKVQATITSSDGLIQNNLTILYSICVVLVLINLAAQIKIIFQMVHLFFQFRKKDDLAGFNF